MVDILEIIRLVVQSQKSTRDGLKHLDEDLTYNQLFRKTSPDRKEKAENIAIVKVQPVSRLDERKGILKEKTLKFWARSQTTRKLYEGKVRYHLNSLGRWNGYITCGCSCPDYKFRWETANHRQNASQILFSNGEAPIMTNPRELPSLCKHLAAAKPFVLKHAPK